MTTDGGASTPGTQQIQVLGDTGAGTIFRVGDTVRRPVRPWTAAVHALLRHLEARGFDAAPRVLGFDGRGNEVLQFIPGVVGNDPLPSSLRSDAAVESAARGEVASNNVVDGVAGSGRPKRTGAILARRHGWPVAWSGGLRWRQLKPASTGHVHLSFWPKVRIHTSAKPVYVVWR